MPDQLDHWPGFEPSSSSYLLWVALLYVFLMLFVFLSLLYQITCFLFSLRENVVVPSFTPLCLFTQTNSSMDVVLFHQPGLFIGSGSVPNPRWTIILLRGSLPRKPLGRSWTFFVVLTS